MFLTGVMQALGFLLQCAFFNVFIRIADLYYDINGILFACLCSVAASVSLLFYAGPGRFGMSSMKNFATWGYGFCGIAQFALDIYLVKYVSATQMSLFIRLTIPISVLIAFLVFKRKPSKNDIVGMFIIMFGAGFLFFIQDSSNIKMIIVLVTLVAIFFSSEMFFTESHSQSVVANKQGNLKDRARIVGFASFVSSLMFLGVALSLSLFKDSFYSSGSFDFLEVIPSLSDYSHMPTIIIGILYGLIITGVSRFLLWSATYKIKTENVLAILVFVPFTTYALEWVTSVIFGIEMNTQMLAGERGQWLLLTLILMTIGSALSVMPKIFNSVKFEKGKSFWQNLKNSFEVQERSYELQHNSGDSTDYDVVMQTLNFFDNDYSQVSELFGVSKSALEVIQGGSGKLSFIDDVSKNVHSQYQKFVASKDKLTKINNRLAFAVRVDDLINSDKSFTLAMLDLNKFKPINDNYGHDAGDVVLQTIAKRLNENFEVYRLGGDEFAIISQNMKETFVESIKRVVCQSIEFEKYEFTVGGSVGLANYPNQAKSQDDLIKLADLNLYEDKNTNKIE